MIECVFTVDYEIYGNGLGSLQDLILEPGGKLKGIFEKRGVRFVVFADVAELEMIETSGADPKIDLVRTQLRDFHKNGFELGLHIHPWWYNARLENRRWILDRSEYNLCVLPLERIRQIVDRSLTYLDNLLGAPGYTPIAFRAGHLLFQPTQPLADVLADRGILLDSSVYKGGLWRQHHLDYGHAPKNAFFWRFNKDVTCPDSSGRLLEIPIYTWQAPIWKLLTTKRVELQQTGANIKQTGKKVLNRLSDFMRLRYPLKFDLGQMTREEMTQMLNKIIRDDLENPSTFHPVVMIAHTKDPIDFDAVDALLDDLEKSGIKISTFSNVLCKIKALDARFEG
jgi:hypothetical protein